MNFKNYNSELIGYPLIDTFPIEYITNGISFNTTGEFLQFSNRNSFDFTMDELKRLDNIIITPDSLQDSIGLYPILEKFDSKFINYLSLRQKIENEIDSLSEENIYNPVIYDPEDHFIGDIIYRTLLNHQMEVQISETIYKVINKEWVTEFNSDINLLNFVRNYDITNLNNRITDTVINNIKFIYTGSEFELDNQGNFKRSFDPNCGISLFNLVNNPNGEVSFIIYPMYCSIGSFVVDFGDGTISPQTIVNGYFLSNISHTYAKNGNYLAKIIFNCPCGTIPSTLLVDVNVTNLNTNNNCQNFPSSDFSVDLSNVGKIKLKSLAIGNNLKYYWRVITTNEKNSDEKEDEYLDDYSTQKTIEVCLKIYNTSGCFSEKCSTIIVPESCCQRGHTQQIKETYYSANGFIKSKIFRWNGGPLGRNVGAKTVNFEFRKRKFSLRKNRNSHWIRTRAEVSVTLNGEIWAGNRNTEKDRNYGVCYFKLGVNKNEFKLNKANADVVYNPGSPTKDVYNRIYTKKQSLYSEHKIKINGTNYSTNLYLTKCW
jgi:hypothetical protein